MNQNNSPVMSLHGVAQTPVQRSEIDADKKAFYWDQLISRDLKIYRDNLSAFGCPDFIVRSIIMGQINELFEPRRESTLVAMQNSFWDYAIRGESAVRNEWIKPMEALSAERQAMVDDVLGINYGIAEDDLESRRNEMERNYSWLPIKKRDQLFALEEERRQHLEEWAKAVGSRMDGHLTVEDNDELQQIQNEFESAEDALLTPEELAEFNLRSSKNSLWASGLSGFQATEDEWRGITQLQNEYDEAQEIFTDPNSSDNERQQAQQTLQKPLEQAIKETLGADRYAQYELANNNQFQEIYNVTQRYGLPQSVADQAFQIQQAADTASEQLLQNPNVAPDARQSALAAIQQETEQTLSETLGEKVFSTYKEYRGSQ